MYRLIIIFSLLLFFISDTDGQQINPLFHYGEIWKDADGKPINAHGAGLLLVGDTHYMYGEIKAGTTRLVPGQNWEDYRVPAGGISCYSSQDLIHWKYKGIALAATRGDSSSDLDSGRVIERPKVIYNTRTKKYVMWMHIDKADYSFARAGVAVSENPEGPFHYEGSVCPNGQMSRDMTLFKDDDDKAYLIYSSEDNNTMQVCLLSEDYLSPTSQFNRILKNERREAPAIFKYQGKYFLITSFCSGWSANPAVYWVADHIMGPWQNRGNPCVGPHAETTFESQSTFILPVQNKPGEYVFMADRWNKTNLPESRYIWLPLSVREEKVEINMSGWKESARIVLDSIPVIPYSIIQYAVDVKCRESSANAYTQLRFYDSLKNELMEYRTGPHSSPTFQTVGYYTEAPPFTKYAVISVETDWWIHDGIDTSHYSLQDHTGSPITRRPALCDRSEYLRPFWNSDSIFNETVLLYSINGKQATGNLLYTPSKIISVRSFDLQKKYKKGIDYNFSGKNIIRLNTSSMPFRADTSFDTKHNLAWYDLQSQWVVVTYVHDDRWTDPHPSFKGDRMPHVMEKLTLKKPLKILAYGMSITRGQDVSGYVGVKPFMPTYVDLFVWDLKRRFGYDQIEMINAGLPGAWVSWGADYADQYINPVRPDLVIIDFGMNDFWRYTPSEFKSYVERIISVVKQKNPEAEFLLISNMDFDPAYILDTDKNKIFYQTNMQGYKTVLRELETKGTINLDMTSLSDILYKKKKAKDCIVNPLHPNDYMARWYAQGLAAIFNANQKD